MIKAIIFDCFGVLVTEGWHALLDGVFKSGEVDKKKTALQIHNKANRGLISYDEFVSKLSDLSGASPELIAKYLDRSQPNEKLLAYIGQSLKPHYKLGILSNASGNWLSEMFTPQQLQLFDETVLSYQTSRIKPEPEIYKLILEKLSVKPSEAIFVDDNLRQVDGAKNVGLNTIHYQNFEQMKQELEKLLAKP